MAGEKRFEKKIEKYLESQGIYQNNTKKQNKTIKDNGWFFKVWGGGFQSGGIPDLICNINGFFLSIELKDIRGQPSELQVRNTKLINQTNGIGLILYPQGFETFKKIVGVMLACNSHIPEYLHLSEIHLNINSGILKS